MDLTEQLQKESEERWLAWQQTADGQGLQFEPDSAFLDELGRVWEGQ